MKWNNKLDIKNDRPQSSREVTATLDNLDKVNKDIFHYFQACIFPLSLFPDCGRLDFSSWDARGWFPEKCVLPLWETSNSSHVLADSMSALPSRKKQLCNCIFSPTLLQRRRGWFDLVQWNQWSSSGRRRQRKMPACFYWHVLIYNRTPLIVVVRLESRTSWCHAIG